MWSKKLAALAWITNACIFSAPSVQAADAAQLPLLVIGASYSEGKTPFNNGVAPLGGASVGSGSYLNLGEALTRETRLPGFVINEGQAGAGTFARVHCDLSSCTSTGWDSYQTQLERALARVALPPTFTQYNAKYVVITVPNDCLHPDAFGTPQNQSMPCTWSQQNAVVDRLIAVGRFAYARGVTPIYNAYPRYADLNLGLFRSLYGFSWVIGEQDYSQLRALNQNRIQSEFPQAIILDMWKDFVHIGDGLHPNYNTAQNAAKIVAKKIVSLDHPGATQDD